MRYRNRTLNALVIAALAVGLTACESNKEEVAEEAAEATAEATNAPEELEEAAEESAEEMAEVSGEDADVLQLTYGGNAANINSVIFHRLEGQHDVVGFYEDDVDCATIKETPGKDKAVLTAEFEPVGDLAEGKLVVNKVMYGDEDAPTKSSADDPNAITVTKVKETDVEGRVRLYGLLEDDAVELEGDFAATICDVDVRPVDG